MPLCCLAQFFFQPARYPKLWGFAPVWGLVMKKPKKPGFNAQAFLDSTGIARKVVELEKKASIYAQGQPSDHVMYIQTGSVKLSVVNSVGKEAIVAVLGPGDFFGEGCLAGQKVCMGSATALAPTTVLPNISQETLAEMVGTTRSRVNLFMNKFKKLGFIHNNGGLHIDSSLLSVVLHD